MKGQSGNPRGRPPKGRALTEILRKAGSKTLEVHGRRISRKRLVADLLWQAAAIGKVIFPDGRALEVSFADWFDVVKFIYSHIDGPPKVSMELTGEDGKPISVSVIEIVKDYGGIAGGSGREGEAKPASGSNPDVG
ncbi:MAG TPA: hypothetical protein G4O02_13420 [Caldilineae bacterium]|nr:hypothetical protein [Caldilineae bacterium]